MFAAAETGRRIDAQTFEARSGPVRVELLNAQFDLQHADFPVVMLIDGDDRLACNRILQGIGEWLDARHVVMHVLGERTEAERLRPPEWRYWSRLPRAGQTSIFVHGWVYDAIREACLGQLNEAALERRIAGIRAFEKMLAEEGTLLLKFWYHVPREELGRRIARQRHVSTPSWRLGEEVEQLFENYADAIALAERVVAGTSTGEVPWHVVEGTDPLHAGLETAERVLAGLTARLAATHDPTAAATPAPTGSMVASKHASTAAQSPRKAGSRASVLDDVDLTASVSKDAYAKQLAHAQTKLDALFAEAAEVGLSSVIVFEGWDAAGKGGTIRRLCRAIDPRLYRVIPIGAPTAEERAHHYFWRFWRHVPRAGRMTVFDRSWYGRVLVERVEGLTDEATWRRAYEEIRDFEAQLAAAGVLVLKFWLHISPDEQLRRFEAREKTPFKKYKITDEDYRNRERWPEYELAIDEMVARTSTLACPWHLVSAEQKRFARLEVLEIVRKQLARALKDRRGAAADPEPQLG